MPQAGAVPARLDHRHQHDPGAHRRQDRADHHQGLPRHLRDRPHQPAGCLQPVLPQARAAGRARAALRGQRAHARRRRDRHRARRGRRSPRSAPSSTQLGIEAAAILFLNCYRNPEHEPRAKAILEANHPEHVRLGLARAVAGISRVRALLDRRRQRLYRPEGAALSRRDRQAHPRRRFRRLVPGRAIDRRPLRRGAGASRTASACWNPARRRASSARRRCAARSASTTPSPSTWAAPPPRPASSTTASR